MRFLRPPRPDPDAPRPALGPTETDETGGEVVEDQNTWRDWLGTFVGELFAQILIPIAIVFGVVGYMSCR
jgi:hypothetical protein